MADRSQLSLDRDSVLNWVKNLGRSAFNSVADTILQEVFHLTPINVDGPRDGGSDRRAFRDSQGAPATSYQITVQDTRWREKALEDARKSAEKLRATAFYFLTSREHGHADLRQLEQQIATTVGVHAVCLGAREITGLLLERNLVGLLLDAIGIPVPPDLQQRVDSFERSLHMYVAIASETARLRENIHDDTILVCLSEQDGQSRRTLVDAAAGRLGLDVAQTRRLDSRADSLCARGILKQEQGAIWLTRDTAKRLREAGQIYDFEMQSLSAAQASLLQGQLGLPLEPLDHLALSALISRCFVRRELDSASRANIRVANLGLFRSVGDPMQDLRDFLVHHQVLPANREKVILELVDMARGHVLVKKLARAALFVAVEGGNVLSAAKALGAKNWSEVTVVLDASVAIPYLCTCLFGPSAGRYSEAATFVVDRLKAEGARVCIPYPYIEECAAHLLRGLDYTHLDALPQEARFSPNGYISHYQAMKLRGEHVPESVLDYLAAVSPAVKDTHADNRRWVRDVMDDIQQQLSSYHVEYEPISTKRDRFHEDASRVYFYQVRGRIKPSILVEHDVLVLAHLCRKASQQGRVVMCLTWDASMISAGRAEDRYGSIIGPDEAADLTQQGVGLSEARLCSLAHSLAKVQYRADEVAAQILDRILHIAQDRVRDWEFQERMKAFKAKLLEKIDFSRAGYAEWVEQETDAFLAAEGFAIPQKEMMGELQGPEEPNAEG